MWWLLFLIFGGIGGYFAYLLGRKIGEQLRYFKIDPVKLGVGAGLTGIGYALIRGSEDNPALLIPAIPITCTGVYYIATSFSPKEKISEEELEKYKQQIEAKIISPKPIAESYSDLFKEETWENAEIWFFDQTYWDVKIEITNPLEEKIVDVAVWYKPVKFEDDTVYFAQTVIIAYHIPMENGTKEYILRAITSKDLKDMIDSIIDKWGKQDTKVIIDVYIVRDFNKWYEALKNEDWDTFDKETIKHLFTGVIGRFRY